MAQKRNTPAEFRYRAEKLRAIAEITVDPGYREILLICASDYDGIARRVEAAQWAAEAIKGFDH